MIQYCEKCGHQLGTTCSWGTKFCSNCGAVVDWLAMYEKESINEK
jgi:hypothetical protein